MPRRWIASLDAFSRMYLRSASVRPGKASLISTRRTSVGEPYDAVSPKFRTGQNASVNCSRARFIRTMSKDDFDLRLLQHSNVRRSFMMTFLKTIVKMVMIG
jgi:hypothetical protein